MAAPTEGPTEIKDGSAREEPMEDPADDSVEPTEEELFTGLTEALTEDASFFTFTYVMASRVELERQVDSLTFERDQVRSLMLTTLVGRDITYAKRDTTFVARDKALTDRDAHRAYADEVIG